MSDSNDNNNAAARMTRRPRRKKKKCFTAVQQRRLMFGGDDSGGDGCAPPCVVALCPSMDLACLPTAATGSGSSSTSLLQIHRTLHWQRIAQITVHRAAAAAEPNNNREEEEAAAGNISGIPAAAAAAAWRPDGRFLAVAEQGGSGSGSAVVSLYSLEGLLQADGDGPHHHDRSSGGGGGLGSGGGGGSNTMMRMRMTVSNSNSSNLLTMDDCDDDDDDEESAPGKVFVLHFPPSHNNNHDCSSSIQRRIITALSWHHVGRPHPAWPPPTDDGDDGDNDSDEFWTHRRRFYVDRERHVLPPSDYHQYHHHPPPPYNGERGGGLQQQPMDNHSGGGGGGDDRHDSSSCAPPEPHLPTCQTPLSVLCVATGGGGAPAEWHLFLHGRYPLARLDAAVDADVSMKAVGTDENANNNNKHNNHTTIRSILASTDLVHYIVTSSATTSSTTTATTPPPPPQLTICSLPALARRRSDWQTVAAQFCQVRHHLAVLRRTLPEVAAQYRSALKAVDLKLDGLRGLLANYGLLLLPNSDDDDDDDDDDSADDASPDDPHQRLRQLLVQYVLSGHSSSHRSRSSNLSNAVDQFFTGAAMSDPLVQRVDRALQGGLANVERAARRQLLAPARALVHSATQVYGLMRSATDNGDGSSTDDDDGETTTAFLPRAATAAWMVAAAQLLQRVEAAVAALVRARCRLRDFVAWARSAGAAVRARGTAPGSVQRQSAAQRRAPDAVTARLLSYLREGGTAAAATGANEETNATTRILATGAGITERVLALQFAAQLQPCAHGKYRKEPPRPESPAAAAAGGSDDRSTVATALEKVAELAQTVLNHPQSVLQVQTTTVSLWGDDDNHNHHTAKETPPPPPLLATTTRVGKGGCSDDASTMPYGQAAPGGYFAPTASTSQDTAAAGGGAILPHSAKQWCVTATTNAARKHEVQLRAFALTWTSSSTSSSSSSSLDAAMGAVDDDDDDDDETDAASGIASDCYWTVCLQLPPEEEYTVRELAFYGDDGKSSLSSGVDSGTGEEGRQALGMLVSRRGGQSSDEDIMDEADASETEEQLELWLVPYDGLAYARRDFQVDSDTNAYSCAPDGASGSSSESIPTFRVHPLPDPSSDGDEDGEGPRTGPVDLAQRTVHARTRTVAEAVDFGTAAAAAKPCRLVLSGSRGIGAVVTQQQGGTALEVLDLEEDEEEEEEGEGEDDDDEAEDMDAEAESL